MEINFSEPTLDVYRALQSYKTKTTPNEDNLLSIIKSNCMIGLYEHLCSTSVLTHSPQFYHSLNAHYTELKSKIICTDDQNDNAILSFDIKLAEFYAKTFKMKEFTELVNSIQKRNKTSSLNMDIILCKFRLYFILTDIHNLHKTIEKGNELYEQGCDWDRRNRYKVYRGLYLLAQGRFMESGSLLYNCLPTFECKELLKYEDLVLYYIFCSLTFFSRKDLDTKIIQNGNVNETLSDNKLGIELCEYLYGCKYQDILPQLYLFVDQKLRNDVFLFPFIDEFVRMVIEKSFLFLLEAHKSLSLQSFANLFGVSESYIEYYVKEFICDSKLHCMIDKVNGMVFVTDNKILEGAVLNEKGTKLMTQIKKNI